MQDGPSNMVQMKSKLIIVLILLFGGISGQELFSTKITFMETTKTYFGDDNYGTIAAFSDFDGTGSPDLFVITDDGHGVDIYFKTADGKQWHKPPNSPDDGTIRRMNDTIISVTPSDFSGDKVTDVLVIVHPEGDPGITAAYLYVAADESLTFQDPVLVSAELQDQPLVADYNFDLVADIFGAKRDNSLLFWVYNKTSFSFDEKIINNLNGTGHSLVKPNSNAFVDLNNDLKADLLVALRDETGHFIYQVWVAGRNNWTLYESHTIDDFSPFHVGQSSFVDVDADGRIDQVVPVCFSEDCLNSSILVYKWTDKKWKPIINSKSLQDWHFVPPDDSQWAVPVGFKLREGDLNLDSYSDFVAIMRQGTNISNEVVILINNEGMLTPDFKTPALHNMRSPFVAAFADLSTTAHLDIIVGTDDSETGELKFHVMTNKISPDANFIKVEVVTRTCSNKCNSMSYVSNPPGCMTAYETTTPSGERQLLTAAQLSQSSYLALQLPYVVMGLGQNPNFVDEVVVAIPNSYNETQHERRGKWLSLIPNSQLVVYPSPLDNPSEWQSNLLIHPSQSVLITGLVLIGTCCFIGIIAGLLHLLERRQDDKQKKQEAHKFHFDAM